MSASRGAAPARPAVAPRHRHVDPTIRFVSARPKPVADARREVNAWRDESGTTFARGFSDRDRHWIVWPSLATFAFSSESPHLDIWIDPGATEAAARDAAHRVLRPMILQAMGWQALHAGAVATPKGAVILCGLSGHGKSTLSYTLSTRGYPQVADDAVVLDPLAGAPTVVAVPFSPKLEPDVRSRLAGGSPATVDPGVRVPVHTVCVLEQRHDEGPILVDPVPAARAFATLVTHAHAFDAEDPDAKFRLVQDYLSLAERVPVYRMRYPRGLERLDDVCDALLDTAGLRPAAKTPAEAPESRLGAAADVLRLLPGYLAFGVGKRLVRADRLVRWAWSQPRDRVADTDVSRAVRAVTRLGQRLDWSDRECLQRSLVLYRALSRAGAEPHLVIGFAHRPADAVRGREAGSRLAGHAWVELPGTRRSVLSEDVSNYAVVARFGEGGMRLDADAG